MSDDNEATEEDEPTRCRKCGGFYNLRDGEDPTLYCDWCAHKVVDELTAKLADAERAAEFSESARKEWADKAIAAIARAEVAERETDNQKQLAEKVMESRIEIAQERDELRRAVAAMEHRNGEFAKALEDYEAQVLSLEADKARLDWIQETKATVYAVYKEKYHPKTDGSNDLDIEQIHLGFSASTRFDETKTVREAIDAARKPTAALVAGDDL